MTYCQDDTCKSRLTREDTAKIAIVAVLLGLVCTGLNVWSHKYLLDGTYDERILPSAGALVLTIGALACINLNRFEKSLFELIAIPSPLYGALFCTLAAFYNINWLLHLM
jgi:drug/metabolite transporter (DMT)-like permease